MIGLGGNINSVAV